MTVKAEIMQITPSTAEKMLAHNTNNRTIRPAHVASLVRDIENGNWHVNGDAIRFNGNGDLLDGQHRLAAVVKSGIPIKSLVVRGVNHDARVTIDTGVKRTAGDFFHFNNVKAANVTAAACRYAMIMRRPNMISQTYTNSELWDFYEEHPEISQSVDSVGKMLAGMQSITVATHYIATQVAPDIADDFVEAWVGGYGDKGNPCVTMRNKITDAVLRGHPYTTIQKIRMSAWSLVKLTRNETTTTARIPNEIIIRGWSKRDA